MWTGFDSQFSVIPLCSIVYSSALSLCAHCTDNSSPVICSCSRWYRMDSYWSNNWSAV